MCAVGRGGGVSYPGRRGSGGAVLLFFILLPGGEGSLAEEPKHQGGKPSSLGFSLVNAEITAAQLKKVTKTPQKPLL